MRFQWGGECEKMILTEHDIEFDASSMKALTAICYNMVIPVGDDKKLVAKVHKFMELQQHDHTSLMTRDPETIRAFFNCVGQAKDIISNLFHAVVDDMRTDTEKDKMKEGRFVENCDSIKRVIEMVEDIETLIDQDYGIRIHDNLIATKYFTH